MILLCVLLLLQSVLTAPVEHPDLVKNLPDAPAEPLFPLYSGFLQVSDNDTNHQIFYVLTEAIRANPAEAPLLVWQNGGPGASSLLGLMLENGPYLFDARTGRLRYNDFSWNQYANVLYIESPTGVGFSSNYTELFNNDAAAARLNRKAVDDFMTRVHPRYAQRAFYLTGESYAGVYIPYLAREILNHAESGAFTNPNLKGIAIINARMDLFSYQLAALLQLYTIGMIKQEHASKIFELWNQTLIGAAPDLLMVEELILSVIGSGLWGPNTPYDFTIACNAQENKMVWHIAEPSNSTACDWKMFVGNYLKRADVQLALHVRTEEQPVLPWIGWSNSNFRTYKREQDTIPIYKEIIESTNNFRMLFFTGDTDLVCPVLHVDFGTKRIADQNEMNDQMPLNESIPESWHYLGDFGGTRTSYVKKKGPESFVTMDVLTVRGAGHMVPLSVPDRAFQIINNFISADPKTPIDYSRKIPRH